MMTWRIYISCAAVIVMAWLQAGCFEPAPVYASYKPTDTRAEQGAEEVISRMLVPELYIVESHSEPAHPHLEEPTAGATDKKPPLSDSAEKTRPAEPESERLIGVININTATAEQLQLLPRVGESMSQRIIDYRARRAFARPTHLRRVKGIGKATYARFNLHIVVEGETTLRKR